MNSEKIYNFLKVKNQKKFNLNSKWYSSLNNLYSNTFCFIDNINDHHIKRVNKCNKLIIVTKKKNKNIKKSIIQICVPDPKLIFFKTLKKFYKIKIKNKKPIIGKKSNICDTVKFGVNVEIGNNCRILPNTVIGDNVIIGDNVFIKSNSVIGQDGFQAVKDIDGNLIDIFNVGGVVIGNNVSIGALTTICKGTIDETIIGSYTKIDDHVHIAHNAIIGKNNIITANSIFGGSVTLGNNNFIGLNTTIRSHSILGNNNFVGQHTNLVKNFDNNNLIYGNPSRIKK